MDVDPGVQGGGAIDMAGNVSAAVDRAGATTSMLPVRGGAVVVK